ncbi:MAG: TetR/AcrR family transcriptional regulator [Candidatus Aminicenantes bacterium]|nr:TetR/AcrR family transcriptional regulator [Candidatus Aminicenantes bacterium]
MKKTDPRQVRELQRREDFKSSIVHAAEAVFLRKGIPATTMDDVARQAQLSKATLYRYVRSKGDLLFEIVVQFYDDVIVQLEEVLRSPERSARAKLVAAIRGALAFQEAKRNVARLILMDPAVLKLMRVFAEEESKAQSASARRFVQMLKAKRQALLAVGERLIALGVESGEFRPLDVRAAVQFLEAVIQGHIHSQFLFDSDRTIDELTETIARFVLSGIENKSQPVKGASR